MSEEAQTISPGGALGLLEDWIDLHLRPEVFFAGAGRKIPMVIPIYVLGLGATLDRMEFSLGRSTASGVLEDLSWPAYWGMVFTGAILAGPLNWWIGGWWTQLRVRWSGGIGPSLDLSRRISVFSGLVSSVPVIALAAMGSASYPSPAAYGAQDDGSLVTVIAALAWSIVVSYRAVISQFEVRRGTALLWFAALPGLTYFLVFGGALVWGASAYW